MLNLDFDKAKLLWLEWAVIGLTISFLVWAIFLGL